MNERAEQLITDAGEKVLEYLEATEGFAVEQAPLLAQEIVRWGIWWNIAEGLIGAALCAVTIRWARKTWDARESADTPALEIGAVVAFCTVPFYVFFVGSSAAVVLKALIAPRLYILEQIAGLIT